MGKLLCQNCNEGYLMWIDPEAASLDGDMYCTKCEHAYHGMQDYINACELEASAPSLMGYLIDRINKTEEAARAAVDSHMKARRTQTLTWKDPSIDALAKVLEDA